MMVACVTPSSFSAARSWLVSGEKSIVLIPLFVIDMGPKRPAPISIVAHRFPMWVGRLAVQRVGVAAFRAYDGDSRASDGGDRPGELVSNGEAVTVMCADKEFLA